MQKKWDSGSVPFHSPSRDEIINMVRMFSNVPMKNWLVCQGHPMERYSKRSATILQLLSSAIWCELFNSVRLNLFPDLFLTEMNDTKCHHYRPAHVKFHKETNTSLTAFWRLVAVRNWYYSYDKQTLVKKFKHRYIPSRNSIVLGIKSGQTVGVQR